MTRRQGRDLLFDCGADAVGPPGPWTWRAACGRYLPGFIDTHQHTWEAAIRLAVPILYTVILLQIFLALGIAM